MISVTLRARGERFLLVRLETSNFLHKLKVKILKVKVHTSIEKTYIYHQPNNPFLRLFLVFMPQVQRVYVGHKKAAIKTHFRGTHRYLGNTWFN